MQSHRVRKVLLSIVCALVARQAEGQGAIPGARVRIVRESNQILVEGELVSRTANGVSIRSVTPDSTSSAIEWVLQGNDRLEQSTGMHSNALRGAGVGLLLGAAAGALVGAGTYEEPACDGGCFVDLGRGFSVAAGAVVGAVPGMLLGAVLGTGSKHESWRTMVARPVSLSVTPASLRGVRVTASLAF
ncbi:MAG: hypothetical protein IPP90_20035 [Gemmatimonadaceae bacterium]|nr:hypothetical protein [Gemmatimonadaceae bacterium]